jgi:hypothetical protein
MVLGSTQSFFIPTCLWRWNRRSVPKRRHINFRRRGITQKEVYSNVLLYENNMNDLCCTPVKVISHSKLDLLWCGSHKTVGTMIFTVVSIAVTLFQSWKFAQSRFGKVKITLRLPVIFFRSRITLALFTESYVVLVEGPSKFAELVTVPVCVREV